MTSTDRLYQKYQTSISYTQARVSSPCKLCVVRCAWNCAQVYSTFQVLRFYLFFVSRFLPVHSFQPSLSDSCQSTFFYISTFCETLPLKLLRLFYQGSNTLTRAIQGSLPCSRPLSLSQNFPPLSISPFIFHSTRFFRVFQSFLRVCFSLYSVHIQFVFSVLRVFLYICVVYTRALSAPAHITHT